MSDYLQHQKTLQNAAAECLTAFVNHFDIRHDDIAKLIAHLRAMPTERGWPEWEQAGTLVRLTGRGDATPPDIREVIPCELLEAFELLVYLCVGVGIDDAYGEPTGRPEHNLHEAMLLLERLGVKIETPNKNKRPDS